MFPRLLKKICCTSNVQGILNFKGKGISQNGFIGLVFCKRGLVHTDSVFGYATVIHLGSFGCEKMHGPCRHIMNRECSYIRSLCRFTKPSRAIAHPSLCQIFYHKYNVRPSLKLITTQGYIIWLHNVGWKRQLKHCRCDSSPRLYHARYCCALLRAHGPTTSRHL